MASKVVKNNDTDQSETEDDEEEDKEEDKEVPSEKAPVNDNDSEKSDEKKNATEEGEPVSSLNETELAGTAAAGLVGLGDVIAMSGRTAHVVLNYYQVALHQMWQKSGYGAGNSTAPETKNDTAVADKAAESAHKAVSNESSPGKGEHVQLQVKDEVIVENHAQDFAQLQVAGPEQPSEKQLNFGADQDNKKVFVTSADVNKQKAQAVTKDAWRASLLVFGILSVFACCFCAQWMAAVSKKSRLRLNKYYQRKKYEKDQLVQYISQAQIYRNYYGERLSLPERLTENSMDQRRANYSGDLESQRNSQPILGGQPGHPGFRGDGSSFRQPRSSVEGGEHEHFKRFRESRRQSIQLNAKSLNYLDDNQNEEPNGLDEEVQAMLACDDYVIPAETSVEQRLVASSESRVQLLNEDGKLEDGSQEMLQTHQSVYQRYNLATSESEDNVSECNEGERETQDDGMGDSCDVEKQQMLLADSGSCSQMKP